MIDRLIAWWNRPLEDSERRRMFAFAALALVALGVLLIARQQAGSQAGPAAAPGPPPEAQPQARVAPPQGRAEREGPSADDEEGSERDERYDPSPADVARAKRAARRFLAGYLPYTYGRGDAEEIRSADPALRGELARQPPRVPPTVAHRARPRITTVQAETAARDRASVLTLVADGKRRYTITLALEREGSEWRVADIGG